MEFWNGVWGAVGWLLSTLIFTVYLIVVFRIIVDLFRDTRLAGGWKALWILGLIVFPVITSLIYLLVRGRGMSQRAAEDARSARAAIRDDLRGVMTSPAQEIAQAKTLLDEGAITPQEFTALKTRALAG